MFKNKEFYNGTIEKITGLVGLLFSHIKYVSGRDESGNYLWKDVHLKYGQNFKTRKDLYDYILAEEKISRQLPILCFYLSQMSYNNDIARLSNKTTICNGIEVGTPVPYKFIYQFDLLARTNEAGYSIMEQILPYFTPSLVLRQKDLKGVDIASDIIITLSSPTNNTSDSIQQNKLFAFQSSYTLEVKANLYRPVNTDPSGIIEEIIINNKDMTTEKLLEQITITSEDL